MIGLQQLSFHFGEKIQLLLFIFCEFSSFFLKCAKEGEGLIEFIFLFSEVVREHIEFDLALELFFIQLFLKCFDVLSQLFNFFC